MYNVKELYCLVEDDDGHTYLIPKREYSKFLVKYRKATHRLDEYLDVTYYEDQDEEHLYELQQSVWSCFDGYSCLEGENYYVVLESDLLGDINAE